MNRRIACRAARWDGVCLAKWGGSITPDEWSELIAYVREHRTSLAPFDAVHSGATPGDDLTLAAEMVEPYANVGVTWWVEPVDPASAGALKSLGHRKPLFSCANASGKVHQGIDIYPSNAVLIFQSTLPMEGATLLYNPRACLRRKYVL